MKTEKMTKGMMSRLTDEDEKEQKCLRKFTKEMTRLNKDKIYCTETWVADLGILFYPISWTSSMKKEKKKKDYMLAKRGSTRSSLQFKQ